MDYIVLIHYLGKFVMLYGTSFLVPIFIALIYREYDLVETFLSSGFIVLVMGFIGFWSTYPLFYRKERKVQIRESLALVGLGWIFVTVLGGLPFFLSDKLKIIDSIFESISGFTTTGATILPDVEHFPKALLFWRAFTHFLGGLGMVVIFVSVLPYIGAGGRILFESESFAPDVRYIKIRMKETVRKLVIVYLLFNAINTLLLMIFGMNWFEAVCHAFATLATGGFSTRNHSIEDFHSVPIEVVTIFFMLSGGTNLLLLYDAFLRGRIGELFKNPEWRVYIGLWVVCVLLSSVHLTRFGDDVLSNTQYDFMKALRESAFNFASLMTCTGFSNSNFDVWHSFNKWLLMVVTIIGGCAGSTAGGLKIIRLVILSKILWNKVLTVFQPKTVKPVRVGKIVVRDDIQKEVVVFCILWLVIIVIGSVSLCFTGMPIVSSVSAVIACFSNAGPGLESVGPYENYSVLPNVAKVILCFVMLAGRVEMFSILVLFVPSFWGRR